MQNSLTGSQILTESIKCKKYDAINVSAVTCAE